MDIQVHIISLIVLVIALVVSMSAYASDYRYGIPNYTAQSVIDNNVAIGASGNIAINQAAGDANVQSNSGAISINPTGAASAFISSRQRTATGQANLPEISITRIGDNAFANAAGVISINQISGTGNAQANGFAFAFGLEGEVVTEGVLAQTISNTANNPTLQQQADINIRLLDVEATAFDNSHGIVQLNQSVGTGNATSNNFALRFSLGAN
ncbi:MAG: hypothetical protein KAT25_05235 [Sulfuriflexus sp.]|nr:hypothetical protein [Sulfuriflexus sp.]